MTVTSYQFYNFSYGRAHSYARALCRFGCHFFVAEQRNGERKSAKGCNVCIRAKHDVRVERTSKLALSACRKRPPLETAPPAVWRQTAGLLVQQALSICGAYIPPRRRVSKIVCSYKAILSLWSEWEGAHELAGAIPWNSDLLSHTEIGGVVKASPPIPFHKSF
jgi:hypothetical protein